MLKNKMAGKKKITKRKWRRVMITAIILAVLTVIRFYAGLTLPESLDFLLDLYMIVAGGLFLGLVAFITNDLMGLKIINF